MDYSKEILEELKKMNLMLSKLLTRAEIQPTQSSDFDERVRRIKDRINNKLPQITNNK
jgi:hypothetical protein